MFFLPFFLLAVVIVDQEARWKRKEVGANERRKKKKAKEPIREGTERSINKEEKNVRL